MYIPILASTVWLPIGHAQKYNEHVLWLTRLLETHYKFLFVDRPRIFAELSIRMSKFFFFSLRIESFAIIKMRGESTNKNLHCTPLMEIKLVVLTMSVITFIYIYVT